MSYDGSSWSLHYDEKYGSSYWFNSETGESVWATATTSEFELHNKFDGLRNRGSVDIDSSVTVGLEESSVSLLKFQSSTETLLCCRPNNVMNCVILFMFEYPILVLECILRSLCCLFLSIILLLFGIFCCQSTLRHASMCIFRECIISFAVMWSILIPFMIFFIYQNMNPSESWNIAPLPTIIGWVDCRRFLTITSGCGSHAENVATTSNNCQDTLPGEVWLSPTTTYNFFVGLYSEEDDIFMWENDQVRPEELVQSQFQHEISTS